jgi:hypothetical protein
MPLMSLTNALDAIAVVGAIVLVGEHKALCRRREQSPWLRHQQHCRRLSDYRPHADVQVSRPAAKS